MIKVENGYGYLVAEDGTKFPVRWTLTSWVPDITPFNFNDGKEMAFAE